MNRPSKVGAIGAMICNLVACGGGGSDAGTAPTGTTSYTQGTPILGAVDVFKTTKVDDANNVIAGTYDQTVVTVNADGSYALTQVDPTGSSPVVNGVNYHFNALTRSFDNTGRETMLTDTSVSGTVQTCTFTLESGGHSMPWSVGQTFASTVQEDCVPGSSIRYAESGSVASLESVTVPAGTFVALKVQTTDTWTDADGQNVVEQITRWADPSHWFFTIKTVVSYTRSGNVPTHYLSSQTIELQSRSSS